MGKIAIQPKKLNGGVQIPPSKSISHRAIICASLAKGVSELKNVGKSEDISATIEAMRAFGAKITEYGDRLVIDGTDTLKAEDIPEINCRESGSTVRFLIPLALHCKSPVTFTGTGRLPQRPMNTFFNLFDEFGIAYKTPKDAGLPLTVYGGKISGTIEIEGNISSQFISGLLFSLSLCPHDSEIIITTAFESKGYIDMTIDVLASFGITVHNHNYKKFRIKGNQAYKPINFTVEADYSQAAFYLAAGALGSFVVCKGLSAETKQGDKKIIDVIERMGGKVASDPENGMAALPAKLHGCTVDVSQIPDLVPAIAVLASAASGETVIKGAARLRHKESDRLSAVAEQLNSVGATIIEKGDILIIEGSHELSGGAASSCNDHRIAMALAIAATRCTEPVTVDGAECVKKSYPDFWKDYASLGGDITGI